MHFRFSNFEFQFPGWIVPVFFFFTIFCGCERNTEPVNASEVDNMGMRIVSLAPNLTEILFALGLDEEIVGVTKFSTYPPQAQEKTIVGTFWQPDIEAVIALRPTLMVNLWFEQQSAVVSRMERIGCQTLTLEIRNTDQLYEAIEKIGQAVDRQQQAQVIIEGLRQKRSDITARYADRQKPKVLWVIQRYPFRAAGRQTFINELIEIVGGVNAIGDTLTQYPPVNREEVIGSMPDVIIEPVMDKAQFDEQKQSAAEFYQRYDVVPAVQNGRIYIIDGDLVSRLGPRLDEAAELIAGCLWQE
jgi:iron complex transport system substrate-binding protein